MLIAGGGGPGSIGLLSAGWVHALGAGEIAYLDWDASRRTLAASHFAALGLDTSDGLPDSELEGDFDVLVDASGNPTRLLLARTAPDAVVTFTAGAIYAFGDIPFPVFSMYRRSVTFHTGWVHTRSLMGEPLELIASGAFDPQVVETAVVSFDQAADALAQPSTKLVVDRAKDAASG